ncbi:MAG TPA: DUF2332 domain-containing protein [Streptosporangiaceae bacterium]|nr:DUF2332 domain-containing protein [Streptosporangiaceae bacterium]
MREAVARQTVERLSQVWRHFAERECGTYSPMYAAISHSVADDPELLALVAAAPSLGQQPNVLLAAVHYLVLSGLAHPLADVYADRADPGLAPALFRDVCLSRRHDVGRILASRHTQTNEPGRAAVLAVGLAAAADLVGEPIALLDAGCSAGLNLLIDRYRFDYGPGGGLGPAGSPVTIRCDLRGTAPVPPRLPAIAARLGIDRAPVDLATPDDARWLLACVWPDTGRLARTAAAMELARRHPPAMMSGDMVTDLDAALDTFDPSLPVVVVTTSACGYLSAGQRHAFLAVLERRARRQRLAWLSVDAPGVIDAVPIPPAIGEAGAAAAVMGLVTFETGTAAGRALGLCHAHGAWLEWACT